MTAVSIFKRVRPLAFVGALAGAISATAATVPLFINNATLDYGAVPPPAQIDATAVLNRGFIDGGFNSSLPFETHNTLFFTNDYSGVMTGSPGFRFDNNSGGNRVASERFVNRGSISGSTHILVNSKVVANTNGALLQVSSSGIVKLTGDTVDLSRGGVSAGAGPQPQSSGFRFGNNLYVNGSSIVDLYWGTGDNNTIPNAGPNMNLSGQFDLLPPFFNLNSPSHEVVFPPDFTNTVTVPQFNPFVTYTAHVLSNDVSATRQFIQVVFVPTDLDTNSLATSVRFFPGGAGSQAMIEFASPSIDVITGEPYTNAVYVTDFTGVNTTNAVLTTNVGVFPRTFRPLAFEVSRAQPFFWQFGSTTNAPYDNDLLDSPLYSTLAVPVDYAGYRAQIGTAFQTGGVGSQNPSNAPGRVEIVAGNLNLTQARIAAENFLSIQATNTVGQGSYTIDAPNISLKLSSTNQVLQLDSVGPTGVRRMSGQVSMWSGYWTNTIDINGVTVLREFAVTVLYPEIETVQPVQFSDFEVTANEIIMGDQVNLPEEAVFNTKCLTTGTNAVLNFSGNLGAAQLPMLQCFTNLGQIDVANIASFGPDQGMPLASFFNSGSIIAGNIEIETTNFVAAGNGSSLLSGTLFSRVGPLTASFVTGRVTDSSFVALGAVGSVELTGSSLLISNTAIRADAALVLNVSGTLTDGGAGATNVWSVRRGLEFRGQPAMGDLLCTVITSAPPNFVLSEHVFCSADRGVTNSGFLNNSAIGVLSLKGALFNTFAFRGDVAGKAVYIDYLDLQGSATNFLNALSIDPGFTIYFADASVPAEKLDGAFGGRVRWVGTYAGKFSSTTVPLSGGGTIVVNRALRNSSSIDSDADGIPNAYDPFPFDPPFVQVSIVQLPSALGGNPQNVAQVSWQAAANTTYHVECRSSLTGEWQFLQSYTHGSKNGLAVVTDSINAEGICFYRVVYFK